MYEFLEYLLFICTTPVFDKVIYFESVGILSAAVINFKKNNFKKGKEVMKKDNPKETVENLKEEVALLHHITETVWSVLELENVLKRIVRIVKEYTGADACLIYLYDGDTDKLVLSNPAKDFTGKDKNLSLNIGEGITGWAAANQRTVAIDEESYKDPRFKFISDLKEDSFESFLSVPMLFKGKLVGVINVQRKKPYKHSEREIMLIETIARQVAGAIENAYLYEEMKEKARRIDGFYKVSQSIVSEDYLEDILHLVVSVTAELMGSKICSLMLYDKEKKELAIMATQSLSEAYKNKPPLKVDDSLVGKVFVTRKHIQVRDVTEDDLYKYRDIAEKEGLKSLLSVPLITGNKAIGVLNVYTTYPHSFPVEEIRIIQSLANQAAMAIKNAKLIKQSTFLEEELETRKIVEKAKGALMREYDFTEEEAYNFLRSQSMNSRKSIKEVAEAFLLVTEFKKSGRKKSK